MRPSLSMWCLLRTWQMSRSSSLLNESNIGREADMKKSYEVRKAGHIWETAHDFHMLSIQYTFHAEKDILEPQYLNTQSNLSPNQPFLFSVSFSFHTINSLKSYLSSDLILLWFSSFMKRPGISWAEKIQKHLSISLLLRWNFSFAEAYPPVLVNW